MQLINPTVYYQTEVHHHKLFYALQMGGVQIKAMESFRIGKYICRLSHNITSLLLNVVSAEPFACKTNIFVYLVNTLTVLFRISKNRVERVLPLVTPKQRSQWMALRYTHKLSPAFRCARETLHTPH